MNIVGESRAFEKSLDTREEEREEEKEAHGRLNSLEGGRGKGEVEWRHKTREGTPDEPNKKRFRAQSRFRFARHRLGIVAGIDNTDAELYHFRDSCERR